MADTADRLAQRYTRPRADARPDARSDGETAPAPRGRALLFWGAAALLLVLGFADLARGGETVAPILLVLGYCVAIPLAILRG